MSLAKKGVAVTIAQVESLKGVAFGNRKRKVPKSKSKVSASAGSTKNREAKARAQPLPQGRGMPADKRAIVERLNELIQMRAKFRDRRKNGTWLVSWVFEHADTRFIKITFTNQGQDDEEDVLHPNWKRIGRILADVGLPSTATTARRSYIDLAKVRGRSCPSWFETELQHCQHLYPEASGNSTCSLQDSAKRKIPTVYPSRCRPIASKLQGCWVPVGSLPNA